MDLFSLEVKLSADPPADPSLGKNSQQEQNFFISCLLVYYKNPVSAAINMTLNDEQDGEKKQVKPITQDLQKLYVEIIEESSEVKQIQYKTSRCSVLLWVTIGHLRVIAWGDQRVPGLPASGVLIFLLQWLQVTRQD